MKYRSRTLGDSWIDLSDHLSCKHSLHWHVSTCQGETADVEVPEKAK